MTTPLLAIKNLSASLDSRPVLNAVSFEVREGEFFSLLGPSGCGKTTLLKIISGFLRPASGQLFWHGADITQLPAHKRDLNLVFQNYALFPHMNVFENVAFGLRMQKCAEGDIRKRVGEALELVRMETFAQRRISDLSGGQQQRIALARAIAPRPKLVLLDEPLGALDLQLRKQMQVELKALQRHLGMTFIYVTHDQEEAFTMSDRIAILNRGELQQIATPETLYETPANRFVAQFIGTANFLAAEIISSTRARCQLSSAEFQLSSIETSADSSPEDIQKNNGDVLVRPEQFTIQHICAG
jgi:spermidine/putrescine transport system ATP-binding protein